MENEENIKKYQKKHDINPKKSNQQIKTEKNIGARNMEESIQQNEKNNFDNIMLRTKNPKIVIKKRKHEHKKHHHHNKKDKEKDETQMSKFLKDIQNLEDKRGIDIQKVGINSVEVPLLIQRKDAQNQIVSAKAKMCVDLPAKYKDSSSSK